MFGLSNSSSSLSSVLPLEALKHKDTHGKKENARKKEREGEVRQMARDCMMVSTV